MIVTTTFEFSSYTWKSAVFLHMPETFDLSSYASKGADLLLHMPESFVDASVLSSGTEGVPVLPPRVLSLRRTAPLMAMRRS